MSYVIPSPSRLFLIFGSLLVAGVVLALALGRDEGASAAAVQHGNVAQCATLKGDLARACYAREVGLDLAAISGDTPRAVFASVESDESAGSVSFTNASSSTSAALLCDLHLRAGVTDENRPSWVEWNEQPVS